ncbi:LytTR family DNA-binding domain-containing protein [soil metagenome]
MQIKCFVIDDEPLARKLIESHISKMPPLVNSGSYPNAFEALKALRETPVDLLFLDVQMPELSGLDLIKILTNPPKVILTTAYRDFAYEAYDLDVIDYILKPVSLERFIKAANKYLNLYQKPVKNSTEIKINTDDVLLIKADRKLIRLPIEEIIIIESLKDYIKIHTEDKCIITKESISAMEEKLYHHPFVRIHRSYLISLKKVSAFNHEFVEIHKKQLPFGRTFKEVALKALSTV